MKLDDRDIIAQPSYEPLSNAELVAHIETYAGLIYDTPLAERGAWQDDIIGPARVLLADYETIGRANGYSDDQIADYGAWIRLAVARQRRIETAYTPAAG